MIEQTAAQEQELTNNFIVGSNKYIRQLLKREKELQSELKELRQERWRHQNTVDGLRRLSGPNLPERLRSSNNHSPMIKKRFQAVSEALQNGPLSVKKLAEICAEKGLMEKEGNQVGAVYKIIGKYPDCFERVGGGVWKLRTIC